MNKKYLLLISGIALVLVGVALSTFLGQPSERPDSLATRSDKPDLSQHSTTITYQPGKQSGVPMWFDALDLGGYHHIRYFAENGYSGYRDQAERTPNANWLGSLGFPELTLQYPSLALPQLICLPESELLNRSLNLQDYCPTAAIKLESKAYNAKSPSQLSRALKEEKPLMSQAHILPKHRNVTQWTAFVTDNNPQSTVNDAWLGWVCDEALLAEKNEAMQTWGWQDNQWAQNPDFHQAQCYTPTKLSGWQSLLPQQPKTQTHTVLWQCSTQGKLSPTHDEAAECSASFFYQNRQVTVTIPGTAIAGTAATGLQQQRAKLIQSVWQWLQTAAQRAETETAFSLTDALAQEMQWCTDLDAQGQALQQQYASAKQTVHDYWQQKSHQVISVYPRNPCTRAFHRLLQLQRLDQTNAQNSLSAREQLTIVEQLVDIESRNTASSVSEPLEALLITLTNQVYGEHSVQSLAAYATRQNIFHHPIEVLQRYDAVGSAVEELPLEQRLLIRSELSYRLERQRQYNVRRRELRAAAVRDWQLAPQNLASAEAVSLLMNAASDTLNKDISRDEKLVPISTLILMMQDYAKTLASRTDIKPRTKTVQIAQLGIHAAWHANHLAVSNADNSAQTAPENDWQAWLVDWYDWIKSILNVSDTQGNPPHWLLAIKSHRDAAQQGQRTEPDCPGGRFNGCRFALSP